MSLVKIGGRAVLGCAVALTLAGAACAAGPHDGDWAGVLKTPNGKQMRLVLHVATTAGQTTAVLDSLDQDVSIPAAAYKADGEKASILFLEVGGELEGAFSADNKTFTGKWSQGLALPVTLTRTDPAAPPTP